MDAKRKYLDFINEHKRGIITYGGIALVSLGVGVYEGTCDAPCIVTWGTPAASAVVGVYTETKGVDERTGGAWNEGFLMVMDTIGGFIKGGGLSVLCETAGFGLVKLFS